MTLSDEDKRRIDEEERYRAEVRAKAQKSKGLGCGSGCLWIVLIVFCFVVYVAVTTKGGSSRVQSTLPPSPVYTRSPEQIQAEVDRYKKQMGLVWEYSESTDRMATGTTYIARVRSRNEVEFQFPYQGTQRASFLLRIHPRHGKDVILSIERGQFLCRSDSCRVTVRFDDQKPKILRALESESHDTTVLFIQGFNTFIASLKNAKTMRIEATFYGQGSRVFEFDVSGFDWQALNPQKSKIGRKG